MDTVVDGPTPSEVAAKEKSDHNHHPNGNGACAGISGETGVKSSDVRDDLPTAKPELKPPTKDDEVSLKKAEEESKLVPKSEFISDVTTNGINLNGESLVQVSPSDISDTKTMEPVRSDFGEKVSEEVTPAAVPKETVIPAETKDLEPEISPVMSNGLKSQIQTEVVVQSETVVDKSKISEPTDVLPKVEGDKLAKEEEHANIGEISPSSQVQQTEQKSPEPFKDVQPPTVESEPPSDTKPKAEAVIETTDSKILPEDSFSSPEPPAKVEATALPTKIEKEEVQTTQVDTSEPCHLEVETGVQRYPSTESLPESNGKKETTETVSVVRHEEQHVPPKTPEVIEKEEVQTTKVDTSEPCQLEVETGVQRYPSTESLPESNDKKETTETVSVVRHEEQPVPPKTPEVEKEEAKVESSHVETDLKVEPAKIPELDVVETSKCQEMHVSPPPEKSPEITPEPSPADVPDITYAKPDLLPTAEEPVTITESPLKSPQGLDSKVVDESVSERAKIKSTKEDLTQHLEAEHEVVTSSRDTELDKISLVAKDPEPDVAVSEIKLEAVDVSERKKSIEIDRSTLAHEDQSTESSTRPLESPPQEQIKHEKEPKVETDSDVAAEVVKVESEQIKIPETPAADAADISELHPTTSPEQPQVTSVVIDSESHKDEETEIQADSAQPSAELPPSSDTDQKSSAQEEEVAETKAKISPQVEAESLKVEEVSLTRAESPEPVPSEPETSTVDVLKEEIKEDETPTDDISEKKSTVVEAEIKTEAVIEKEEEIKVSLTSELTTVSTEAEIAVIDGESEEPAAQTSLKEEKEEEERDQLDKLKGEQPSLSPAENISEVAMATDGDGALNAEETVLAVDSTKAPDDETFVDKKIGEIKKEMELNDVEKEEKEEEQLQVESVEETKESPGERLIFTNEFQRSLPLRHEIEEAPSERRVLAADDATPSPSLEGVETDAVEADAETKCSWDDIRMKDDEIEVVASMDVEESPTKEVVEESPTAEEAPSTADGVTEGSTELAPVEELPEPSQVDNKDGDHDSGVDESTQGKDGVEESPSKKPTTLTSTPSSAKGPPKTTPTPKKSPSAPVTASPAKIQKGPSSVSSQGSTTQEKKVPMNKVVVGTTPSPNLKVVKSKIGSLENAHHKAGGGNVKLETKKVDITGVKSKIGSTDNIQHKPSGGDKKILSRKLDWKGQSKVGSLDNTAHKPGGGTKKIETQKLSFKDAKPKVGSLDNRQHKPGGGQSQIEEHKLNFKDKAKSKVGSMDNVTHKPGGGTVQIFDEKLYFKQHSDENEKKDSEATSPSPNPPCNESAENGLVDEAKSPVIAETTAK